ncbi:1541_t:CDS:2 [Entrophospora sp. SA101]|nr:1541_t:CDS:2 [Entrophospora sp. SA101]
MPIWHEQLSAVSSIQFHCCKSTPSSSQFTTVFADISIVVSQDDKAKIGLGVPAVGWTFHTLQSVHEPVPMTDHDFPAGSEQKPMGDIQPICVILVDEGPNENLRHLKNIKTYCQLFSKVWFRLPGYNVINLELAFQNFRYTGEALCDIWHHDLIFGRSVDA